MWFFETSVTHLLSRKYQNRCWVGITEIWYTFSLTTTLESFSETSSHNVPIFSTQWPARTYQCGRFAVCTTHTTWKKSNESMKLICLTTTTSMQKGEREKQIRCIIRCAPPNLTRNWTHPIRSKISTIIFYICVARSGSGNLGSWTSDAQA